MISFGLEAGRPSRSVAVWVAVSARATARGDGGGRGEGVREFDGLGGVPDGVPVGVPETGVRRGLGRGNNRFSSSFPLAHKESRTTGGRDFGAPGRFFPLRVSTSSTLTDLARKPEVVAAGALDSEALRRRCAPLVQCSW